MRAFQPYLHVLRSPTYSHGGQDAVSLEGLPTQVFGRTMHLAGFMINGVMTATRTTAPTVEGMHSFIKSLVFNDGISERFNASLYDLRQFEILENGQLVNADPTVVASTNPVSVRRYLATGPAGFEGDPTDFLIPVAALKSGELRMTFGGLTDWSADTTVLTGSISVTAVLVPLDRELRLPPAFERRTFAFGTTEALVQGKALYSTVAIAKQSNAVFAAGDLSTISWDAGLGTAPVVEVTSITAVAQYFLKSTLLTQLKGEPRNTGDIGERTVNATTPTALQAADFAIQPVIFSPNNSRITKMIVESTSALRVKWTGSSTANKLLVARILEQSESNYAAIAARAATVLGVTVDNGRVKTLDKTQYKGPRRLYMPMVVKF